MELTFNGITLNHNYEKAGVKGIAHVCDIQDGFVTGFRWFMGERRKMPFRIKIENFENHYYSSNEQ